MSPSTVAMVLDRLPRDDPVPDVRTSRRNICSPDDTIRIYVHVQGSGDTLSLFADPEFKLGPVPPDPHNRLTDVFGDVARGVAGRAAEFREKLSASKQARKMKQVSPSAEFSNIASPDMGATKQNPALASSAAPPVVDDKYKAAFVSPNATPSSNKRTPRPLCRTTHPKKFAETVDHIDNLKDRLMLLTGIAPGEMRLIFRGSPMTIDSSTLREYGVCHGETILLTKRDCPPCHSHAAAAAAAAATSAWTASAEISKHQRWSIAQPSPLAAKRYAKLRRKDPQGKGFKFIPRWEHLERGGVFETERPMHLRSEAIHTFDYSGMQEHGHIDFCSFIRRLHGIT